MGRSNREDNVATEDRSKTWELEGISLCGNDTLNAAMHRFPISLQFRKTNHCQLCSVVSGEKKRICLIQKILWSSGSGFLSPGIFSASRGADLVS